MGHAITCSKKVSVAKITNHQEDDGAPPVMKIVELNGNKLEAFIDVGSVCWLIRETAAKGTQTQEANRCFMGFGGSKVKVTRQST